VKNLGSVMVAYMIGWAVFFIYFVTVARRTADLRKEVERLKQTLTQGTRGK
jgi:CcmD family protein